MLSNVHVCIGWYKSHRMHPLQSCYIMHPVFMCMYVIIRVCQTRMKVNWYYTYAHVSWYYTYAGALKNGLKWDKNPANIYFSNRTHLKNDFKKRLEMNHFRKAPFYTGSGSSKKFEIGSIGILIELAYFENQKISPRFWHFRL